MVVSRDVGCIDGKNNSFIVLVEFEFELLSIRRHFPATIVFVKKKNRFVNFHKRVLEINRKISYNKKIK